MKHLKKTLCLLLAVMMLLALGVPAMAAGEMPRTSRIRRCART